MKLVSLLFAAALTGCGSQGVQDLPIIVELSGTDILFSWAVGPVQSLDVASTGSSDGIESIFWGLETDYANLIPSTVTYGVLPPGIDGITERGTLDALISGDVYEVTASRCTPPEDQQPGTAIGTTGCWLEYDGAATFTAP